MNTCNSQREEVAFCEMLPIFLMPLLCVLSGKLSRNVASCVSCQAQPREANTAILASCPGSSQLFKVARETRGSLVNLSCEWHSGWKPTRLSSTWIKQVCSTRYITRMISFTRFPRFLMKCRKARRSLCTTLAISYDQNKSMIQNLEQDDNQLWLVCCKGCLL